MQRLSKSVCYRCRTSIFRSSNPDHWLNSTGIGPTSIFRRHRSGGQTHQRYLPPKHGPGRSANQRANTPRQPQIDPNNIPAWVEDDIVRWARFKSLPERLESYGIPPHDVHPLLNRFIFEVRSHCLSSSKAIEKYGLIRFVQNLSSSRYLSEMDMIYTTIFYIWASDPLRQSSLEAIASPDTLTIIQRLAQAADRYYPEEEYSEARKMNRKVIMHVGPTNSGKTHQALRSLAAAEVGIYAGPLRLLAHEIWERLNLGQIVPLGMEEEDPTGDVAPPVPDTESALDVPADSSVVRKAGNPKYARVCNMITGEEQRIVAQDAPLVSCTVEMVPTQRKVDVAVIDEIQMIADEQRGGGWTSAVLGICAKEVHLCGEETAVPLIQALLKDTGDELIVKRYERLTPLVVETQSLDGNFGLVRKGDCIVTFRRTSIFAIKRQVEQQTGMRCAVVYGRLPPEIRSEQAALFNDPNSGYDVLIGSDSIGMGLNLKIRRIIFEAVRKWDGGVERSLSVSQVKQIAGRAGRYGLHGDEAPGGLVTTLREPDLPFLASTINLPTRPLQYARLSPTKESFSAIANALPPSSTTQAIYTAHMYVSRLQPMYRYITSGEPTTFTMCDFVDTHGLKLTVADRLQLLMAPVPWRDIGCVEIVTKFIKMYSDDMNVKVMEALKGTNYLDALTNIEELIRLDLPPRGKGSVLETLESFHKSLVFYLWMSFRNPVSYNCQTEAADLKTRVEKALDWSLEGMSQTTKTEKPRMTWGFLKAEREQGRQIAYQSRTESKRLGLTGSSAQRVSRINTIPISR